MARDHIYCSSYNAKQIKKLRKNGNINIGNSKHQYIVCSHETACCALVTINEKYYRMDENTRKPCVSLESYKQSNKFLKFSDFFNSAAVGKSIHKLLVAFPVQTPVS